MNSERLVATRIGGLAACVLLLAWSGCSDSNDGSGVNPGDPVPIVTNSPANNVFNTGAAGGAAPVGTNTLTDTTGAQPMPVPVDTSMAAGAGDPFCDALSVFRTSCQGCHGEQLVGGAPMPLVSYEDLLAPAISDPSSTVSQLVGVRIHDTQSPMPPLSQTPLTTEQMGTLDAWLAAGAPNAVAGCSEDILAPPPASLTEGEVVWPADCQERYEIRAHDGAGGPYRVPAGAELNIDISVPVPWAGQGSGAVQALAIRPITNNARVVHHWILYSGLLDFVTSWSPGKPMETFPEGVGVHMPTSGNFRLNMHYYNVGNTEAELDDSGLEVCITRDLKPNTATTYMFSGNATVPPGGRVENVSTCTVNASEQVHLITSSPHMHSYGVYAKLEIVRANGSVEVVEDAPFNWEDQHITPVDAVLNDGDKVRVTCVYENNTDRTITFGDSSADEMCFNFARYYPMDAFTCGGGFGF
ncbi:MAG: hypothetical protein OEZ06_21980 [Myxococcales bacterium]|nr:hypothetical protein [Myxococcales bacterium]